LSQTAGKVLKAFERKFLRKIYGLVLVNGQRRYSYCNEICQSYNEMELTKNIIGKTSFSGSCDEDEAGKSAQHCTESVCRREKTN
jgi:hypothetical protein